MAIDVFMTLQRYDRTYLPSESQVDVSTLTDYTGRVMPAAMRGFVFQLSEYSFDVEQTLNIGSASGGAGAGKVTFNPLSITRLVDVSSPSIFLACASGAPFMQLDLYLRKASGGAAAGFVFLQYTFKLVAVKTLAWSHDEESPRESVTFDYGGLQVKYRAQNPDGSGAKPIVNGWNRVSNVADVGTNPIN
ncbi:type VI secretion system secreted protein Hcp [Motilibacter peucedani]|uniref:Type VI secretion system secreted protein Hcp n=1 Tax=Motilibacter peucedani TaxID=598650 RepID=A0A420XNG9_9ACTN|nr:type VI secretion system tube protein Hcp [Motilibacter peucedani]RKS73751.1 type VI secretion system secreted protein Hcp [Motilibacter peucedani]